MILYRGAENPELFHSTEVNSRLVNSPEFLSGLKMQEESSKVEYWGGIRGLYIRAFSQTKERGGGWAS